MRRTRSNLDSSRRGTARLAISAACALSIFAAAQGGGSAATGGIGAPLQSSGTTVAGTPAGPEIRAAENQQLYDHGNPTAEEQYLLELINRTRSAPAAEALRHEIDLNLGLEAGTISPLPQPPLGFHPSLINAARAHSDWMLDNDAFSHTGVDGSTPGDRMAAAGYPFEGTWRWGENIAWRGSTGQLNLPAAVATIHEQLFLSPDHRVNLLNPAFEEIGLGVRAGTFFASDNHWNAAMATQKFARSGGTPGPLLVGVVFEDQDGEGFYSPGEGIGGVQVRPATGQYYAVTSSSGGYAIPLTRDSGVVAITFSGGPLPHPVTRLVVMGGENIKLDLNLAGTGRDLEFIIGSLRLDPDGLFEFQLQGEPGRTVLVEASADLQTWTSVMTLPLGAPPLTWLDQQTGEMPARFYRATILE